MALCFTKLGVSMGDFWSMPFFTVVSLLKAITPDQKTEFNRKKILDQMRYNSKNRGWAC